MPEVLGKAMVSLVLRVGGSAARFTFTALVARIFGPTGLGRFALSHSDVVIASTIANWGLDAINQGWK